MNETTTKILERMGISALNGMQEKALSVIPKKDATLILSPTGTGKTLAYLLPIVKMLQPGKKQISTAIIVPARELALQIAQVFQQMGSGFRAFCTYGGHPFEKEQRSLTEAPPDVLIGTPGRIVDHIKHNSFDPGTIKTIILDEFDKSLEFGFCEEMEFIVKHMHSAEKKVLLSATEAVEIPDFLKISSPTRIDFLRTDEPVKGLELKEVVSVEKDKLPALKELLCHLGKGKSIIFANFRESADRIANYLHQQGISCMCFHGGMEQPDREKAICLFRNGSVNCLISTDLASRGLDIPEVDYIIHYHLPNSAEVFTHRNGRTARMNASGQAFVILYINEMRPEFLPKMLKEKVQEGSPIPPPPEWSTIYIGKGKRDKISKGDVVGFLIQKGGLTKDELGIVEVKERYAMAAVEATKANSLLKRIENEKIKGIKTIFELIK